jgi:hypothetical protein
MPEIEYFTLQITYQNGKDQTTIEFKDMETAGVAFNLWASNIRERLFRTGFNVAVSGSATRLINPFHVIDAYLIKQVGKYGTK